MGTHPERKKIAVLGGGPAAITAAFELTATPELRDRFDVTVHQLGWRLGGKCASGHNLKPEYGNRIEEHGLHVWFGFYDNAFSVMRAAYEELNRPPTDPLATIEDAFKGCDEIVLYDRQGEGWQDFALFAAPNGLTPGGDYELPGPWKIATGMFEWAVGQLDALSADRPDMPDAVASGRRSAVGWFAEAAATVGAAAGVPNRRSGRNLLRLAHRLAGAGQRLDPTGGLGTWLARALAFLLSRFRDWLWEFIVRERCEQDPQLRLFFTIFDTFASATAGVVADGVLEHGWEAINDRELCDWLREHGARQVTVGATPEQRSPLLRAIYDVAFGYPGGKIEAANVAAGTALNDLLRLVFTYRGSILYKMQAGMADTVFTPLYEVLKARGVKFEFFHAVTDLRLSADGQLVSEIDVVPQVETKGAYEPLVPVEQLNCWPSEPLWAQLHDGERLKNEEINFELDLNPLNRAAVTLKLGEHFDEVVLGISVGALPAICGEIARRHERFARMLSAASTVRTQAFQLWLTKPTPQLGWKHSVNSVVGGYVEPLDTYCDMSHLLARESWPPAVGVSGVSYFCGVLDDRQNEDHAAATARVKLNALAYLQDDVGTLWPRALSRTGGIDWALLADPEQAGGPARLDAQYWRANTAPSDRYVLTPANSVADRLAADESGVENLVLAGDWTRNGIDGGCVEAAMTSGMQAARALIGDGRALTGESTTWLADRPARGRPAPNRSGNATAAPTPGRKPAYVDFGGRATAPPPFLSTEGVFRSFLLEGDAKKINDLCERMLNVPAQGTVVYRPLLGKYVMLFTGSFGRVSSQAPGFEDWGSVRETQIALWVPLVAGHLVHEHFTPDRLCMAMPYILVDNPMSYAGGREDYGYPKGMGIFDPLDGVGSPLKVEAFGGDFSPQDKATWHPLFELTLISAGSEGEATATAGSSPPAGWRRLEELPGHDLFRRPSHGWPFVPGIVEDIIKAIVEKNIRQVFLKQFRDAETAGAACYQVVVEAPCHITSASMRPSLKEWQVTIQPLDSHPIAADLGVASQRTRISFDVTMNMIAEPGEVVAP